MQQYWFIAYTKQSIPSCLICIMPSFVASFANRLRVDGLLSGVDGFATWGEGEAEAGDSGAPNELPRLRLCE